MSNMENAAANHRSLAKGLIAGFIGGLAGTLAQGFAERVFRRVQAEAQAESVPSDPATHLAAAGHELAPVVNPTAADVAHWGFGAGAGAVYGALAEFYPDATARRGASFGLTLQALTQQRVLPALGLVANGAGQASAVPSYVAYGVITEIVRGFVRERL
jgi:putative membrane protein